MTELTGTLRKARETGIIVLGHRSSSVPFSYVADGSGRPVGFSHEVGLLVVEAVKTRLGLPDLTVRYAAVTPQSRITLVQNGTVDLECGTTAHTSDHASQAGFSTTLLLDDVRVMAKAGSPGAGGAIADLTGRNVVVTAGTVAERLVKAANAEQQLGINVIVAQDVGEACQMLELGRAAAHVEDGMVLEALRATRVRKPADWVVVEKPLRRVAHAFMLRKEDDAFAALVNETVATAQTDGTMASLYEKWFEHPVPPRNTPVGLPLTTENKTLFDTPTDKPFD
ncbi:transporter substrate-binding domain-containing protein [Streptomyces sp. NPDC002619]|uniref:transporter substrate-binding domain-containing protein n=1 Tax=Streptomyces sp. NPDC002619 TaxID=3364655 RepID=UPI0036B0301C